MMRLMTQGVRVAVGLLAVVIIGCGREVDTLSAIGFVRPLPDQFLVIQIPPLTQPPSYHDQPDRGIAVDDVPTDEQVSASVVRRGLLEAFDELDERLLSVRDRPQDIPITLSDSERRFLGVLGIDSTDPSAREILDRATTHLGTEAEWVVRRLSGLDPVDTLAK